MKIERMMIRWIFLPAIFVYQFQYTNAKIIDVCKTCGFQTIVSAIGKAETYDTIRIFSGVYIEEQIIITKPLIILGNGFPVVENRNMQEAITICSDNVWIEGIEVRNVRSSYIKDFAGIRLIESDYCTIRNNKLINTFFGIYLQNSSSCTIEGNIVKGEADLEMSSGNAIHLWYCDNVTVKDNLLNKHRDGIYLEFVTNSKILNNTSNENLRYGMHFMFSHFNYYLKNTFRNNGTGVAVMYSDSIVMKQNTFKDNWGAASYGLLLKDIKNSTITDNTFENNTTAIHTDNSTRNTFQHNTINRNGWGIKLMGNCNENLFSENSFTANNFDISTGSKQSNNFFEGNYWSKYKGYDLDRDGTGDVAYNPVTLSSYIVSNYPASIILLRSLFFDLLDLLEKTMPAFVLTDLTDPKPLMRSRYDNN